MAEYIEREAALNIVKRTSGDYAAAWAEISKLPAENVEPVKRGHWIHDRKEHVHCSNCGDGRNIRTQIAWKFCPSCGAEMQEVR